MRILFLSLTLPFFLGASPASATDWAKDFQVWVSPNSIGTQISGLGNWIVLDVSKDGSVSIRNSISTRTVKQTPAQKNRKRTFNVGIRN